MSIKLVASDIDGTIIDKNNNISAKNFEAVNKIRSKNICFALCTGKSYAVSKKICEELHATYGIFGNGTQIIDLKTGEEIFRKAIPKKDLLFIITLSKRYNFHIHIYTDTEIISEKLKYMDLRNYILKSQYANDTLKFKIVNNILNYVEKNEINALSIVITTETTSLNNFKKLLNIDKDIDSVFINKRGIYRDNIINKDYEYLNISPINVNKNEALTYLANFLNINKKDILAVGDNVNDLEMIQNAGIGVAVNESYNDLKNVAKYVTNSTATNGAFAEAIFKFIE